MRVCLDACVLYPTVLREILLATARAGLITPVWSERILEEWRRAALRHSPEQELVASAEIARLSAEFPTAKIPADPAREAALYLPDPNDIHVFATALSAQVASIITLNLRDFPRRELAPLGLVAIHPDASLYQLWLDHPQAIETATKQVHSRAEELAGKPLPLRSLLKRARLPRLGKAIV